MVEIFGKHYYLDFDAVTEKCRTRGSLNDEDGEPVEINVFKYDLIKMCIERVINDFEEPDEGMGVFGKSDLTPSFKIAFNTLIKNEILVEDDE
jgi:hypothetical protein